MIEYQIFAEVKGSHLSVYAAITMITQNAPASLSLIYHKSSLNTVFLIFNVERNMEEGIIDGCSLTDEEECQRSDDSMRGEESPDDIGKYMKYIRTKSILHYYTLHQLDIHSIG